MGIRSRKTIVMLAAVIAAGATAVVVLHGDDTDHGAQGVRGSGIVATETRSVGPFSTVELAGSANLKVEVGRPLSLALRGDDNLLGLVDTRVENGKLVISQRRSFTTTHGLDVVVSTPSLTAVSLTGAGDVAVRGVDAPSFEAALAGVGKLDVDGKATTLHVSLEGAGAASLEHLVARDITAAITGAGAAHVYAERSLDASVSGIGSLLYRGGPTVVTTHVSGAGVVGPE